MAKPPHNENTYRGDRSAKRMPAALESAAPRPGRWAAAERVKEGRCCVLSVSVSELPKDEAAFREAIELDGTDAGAYAGLAMVHCAEAALRIAAPLDAYGKAKSAALRALFVFCLSLSLLNLLCLLPFSFRFSSLPYVSCNR